MRGNFKQKNRVEEYTREDLEKLASWQTSPYEWLKDCVYTKDEARAGLGFEGVRKFPHDEEYLLYSWYIADKYPVTWWNKSRRMMMTWLFCIRLLYKCLFLRNLSCYVISYKFEDANYLLRDRIYEIYQNIPAKYKRLHPDVDYAKKGIFTVFHPEVDYDERTGQSYTKYNNSSVQAISAGADQLRSRTASYILWDEIAKQPLIIDTLQAVQPTIRGGGNLVGVSTPRPNEFKTLFYGLKRTEKLGFTVASLKRAA